MSNFVWLVIPVAWERETYTREGKLTKRKQIYYHNALFLISSLF
jgi:hypothetical protein